MGDICSHFMPQIRQIGLKMKAPLSFLPPFQMVRDRFKAFAYDTMTTGQGRVGRINRTCDQLIKDNHTDVAVICAITLR